MCKRDREHEISCDPTGCNPDEKQTLCLSCLTTMYDNARHDGKAYDRDLEYMTRACEIASEYHRREHITKAFDEIIDEITMMRHRENIRSDMIQYVINQYMKLRFK